MERGIIANLQQVIRSKRQLYGTLITDLHSFFHAADRDSSGRIEISELQDAFSRLDVEVGEKDLEKVLATIDVDDDGAIDYMEFKRWMTAREGRDAEAGGVLEGCTLRIDGLEGELSEHTGVMNAFGQFGDILACTVVVLDPDSADDLHSGGGMFGRAVGPWALALVTFAQRWGAEACAMYSVDRQPVCSLTPAELEPLALRLKNHQNWHLRQGSGRHLLDQPGITPLVEWAPGGLLELLGHESWLHIRPLNRTHALQSEGHLAKVMAEHEKQLHQDEKAKKTQEAHPRHNNPIVVPAYNIQRTDQSLGSQDEKGARGAGKGAMLEHRPLYAAFPQEARERETHRLQQRIERREETRGLIHKWGMGTEAEKEATVAAHERANGKDRAQIERISASARGDEQAVWTMAMSKVRFEQRQQRLEKQEQQEAERLREEQLNRSNFTRVGSSVHGGGDGGGGGGGAVSESVGGGSSVSEATRSNVSVRSHRSEFSLSEMQRQRGKNRLKKIRKQKAAEAEAKRIGIDMKLDISRGATPSTKRTVDLNKSVNSLAVAAAKGGGGGGGSGSGGGHRLLAEAETPEAVVVDTFLIKKVAKREQKNAKLAHAHGLERKLHLSDADAAAALLQKRKQANDAAIAAAGGSGLLRAAASLGALGARNAGAAGGGGDWGNGSPRASSEAGQSETDTDTGGGLKLPLLGPERVLPQVQDTSWSARLPHAKRANMPELHSQPLTPGTEKRLRFLDRQRHQQLKVAKVAAAAGASPRVIELHKQIAEAKAALRDKDYFTAAALVDMAIAEHPKAKNLYSLRARIDSLAGQEPTYIRKRITTSVAQEQQAAVAAAAPGRSLKHNLLANALHNAELAVVIDPKNADYHIQRAEVQCVLGGGHAVGALKSTDAALLIEPADARRNRYFRKRLAEAKRDRSFRGAEATPVKQDSSEAADVWRPRCYPTPADTTAVQPIPPNWKVGADQASIARRWQLKPNNGHTPRRSTTTTTTTTTVTDEDGAAVSSEESTMTTQETSAEPEPEPEQEQESAAAAQQAVASSASPVTTRNVGTPARARQAVGQLRRDKVATPAASQRNLWDAIGLLDVMKEQDRFRGVILHALRPKTVAYVNNNDGADPSVEVLEDSRIVEEAYRARADAFAVLEDDLDFLASCLQRSGVDVASAKASLMFAGPQGDDSLINEEAAKSANIDPVEVLQRVCPMATGEDWKGVLTQLHEHAGMVRDLHDRLSDETAGAIDLSSTEEITGRAAVGRVGRNEWCRFVVESGAFGQEAAEREEADEVKVRALRTPSPPPQRVHRGNGAWHKGVWIQEPAREPDSDEEEERYEDDFAEDDEHAPRAEGDSLLAGAAAAAAAFPDSAPAERHVPKQPKKARKTPRFLHNTACGDVWGGAPRLKSRPVFHKKYSPAEQRAQRQQAQSIFLRAMQGDSKDGLVLLESLKDDGLEAGRPPRTPNYKRRTQRDALSQVAGSGGGGGGGLATRSPGLGLGLFCCALLRLAHHCFPSECGGLSLRAARLFKLLALQWEEWR